MEEYLYSEFSKVIISAFYKVYNTLGYGFLERVYENSLRFELEDRGFTVEQQKPINVYYNGKLAGVYYADLIVDNKIILELKTVDTLSPENEYQLINYLKATDLEVGLLLNFGKKPQVCRKAFSNENKVPKQQ